MEVPEVTYAKDEERIAIEGTDEEIYPRLGGQTQAEFNKEGKGNTKLITNIGIYPYTPPEPGRSPQRPEAITFSHDDLLAFHGQGLEQFIKGNWSIYWNSKKKKQTYDVVHSNEWRSVMLFRAVEFMIRPKDNFKHEDPKRLYFDYRNVQQCLQAVLNVIEGGGMGEGPLMTFTGSGHLMHQMFRQDKLIKAVPVEFEWRIDRAKLEKMNELVRQWRYDQFTDGAKEYHEKKKEYNTKAQWEAFNQSFLQQREPEIRVTEPGGLFRKYVEPRQPEPREPGSSRPGKRSSTEMSASQELSPSSKRRSVGSQSSYGSRSNAPQSLTTSPEMGRGTPVTGSEWQAMPRDVGWGRQSVGSRSSVGSQSELAPQSLAVSPEMGRQTPVNVAEMPPMSGVVGWGPQRTQSVAGWEHQMMPPPPNPTYGHTGAAYGHMGYGQFSPAASPRLVHPLTQTSPTQYGSTFTGYWGPTAPAHSSYPPYTGYYPSGAAGVAPPMPTFPGTTGGSWGVGTYPATPPTSSAATNPSGVDPFQFLDPSSVPAPGGGIDASQYQDTSAGAQPGWWDEAGNYIRSNHPSHGDQSGHQGQYQGGHGSGQ